MLQTALYFEGDYPEAITVGDRLLNQSGRHQWSMVFLATTLAASGDLAGARAVTAELSARAARDSISPFNRAVAAAVSGDAAGASALLAEALARRDAAIPVFARWAFGIPSVKALPMSAVLIDAMKLPGPRPG